MLRKPMTTEEVEKIFPEDTEDRTCSMRCTICNSRIWFVGDWWDKDIPFTFGCPYCKGRQKRPTQMRFF